MKMFNLSSRLQERLTVTKFSMTSEFTYVKEDRLLNTEQIESLSALFEGICEKNKYTSSYSNVRQLKKDAIAKEPLLAFLCEELHSRFSMMINANDLTFEKLWFVSSTSDVTDKSHLPYIPHFDKQRYLKAMVYLHDVSIEHGPIHFGTVKDEVNIEGRRIRLPPDYKDRGLNTIRDIDLRGELAPILGKAGDVIFFDTNAPHKGGVVTKGYCRKVLRFDFDRPCLNPKPSEINMC